jgi:hypothetical protein
MDRSRDGVGSEDGVYQLVLQGATAQTISFSDRPHRIVGSISTAGFLASLGFSGENPPNAAIVVELLNPSWDAASQTLACDVIVLGESTQDGFGDLARQAEPELPEGFGHACLFVDDCPDGTDGCFTWCQRLGSITFGKCWHWSNGRCSPCRTCVAACRATYAEAGNDPYANCHDELAACGSPGCGCYRRFDRMAVTRSAVGLPARSGSSLATPVGESSAIPIAMVR